MNEDKINYLKENGVAYVYTTTNTEVQFDLEHIRDAHNNYKDPDYLVSE